jgi:UDP-glucose:(heptosyl)LPS alpha-1,3-glucosyltransferase
VDLARFHPARAERLRAPARGEVGIAPDAWVALFLGSGFERKGLATALDAFARVGDASSRLLVVGKGDAKAYRARAERLSLDQRVLWLGPRADPARWLAAADAVVLPSRYEPFGNVHLEALASGVPVVASARAGGAEVVEDGRTGAVVEPEDAAQVATALTRVREMSRADVVAACRRAAEPFTYAAQVAGFEALYRRRLAARGDFP